MNNSMNTYICRRLAFALFLAILNMACLAQNNVRLLNGSAFISEITASAADERLALELPNHDVRISYVTGFIGVQDRYEVYQSNELIPFSQIPHPGGIVPATQAQKDAAVNAGIHHAITTLSGGSEATIHIIYAVSVSLNTQGEEEFSSRKFFKFGSAVDRRSEAIVKQVKPDPELAAAGIVSGNDTYLTDYVDELIEALKDEDYVIDGTFQYGDDIFFDGDTIVLDYSRNTPYMTNSLPPQKTIQFKVRNAPGASYVWTESPPESGGYDQQIIASANGETATLKAIPYHFTTYKTITAKINNELVSSVVIIPVNIQIGINPTFLEGISGEEVDIQIVNNIVGFGNRGSYTLKVSFQDDPDSDVTIPYSMSPETTWIPSLPCSQKTFSVDLVDGNAKVLASSSPQTLRVKCPFDLDGIRISGTNNKNAYSSQIELVEGRVIEDEETLYMVAGPDIADARVVQIESLWDGPRPEYNEDDLLNDYWTEGLTDEPKWTLATSGNGNPAQPTRQQKGDGKFFATYYNQHFPQSLIDPGQTTINYEDVSIEAFGETKSAKLAFLRENKSKSVLQTPYDGAFSFLVSKLNFVNDKVKEFGKVGLKIDIQTTYKESFYNAEASDQTYYYKYHTEGRDLKFEFGTDELVFPPPLGYTVPNILKIGLYAKGRLFLSPEYKRVYRRPHFEPKLSADYVNLTLAIPGGGKVEFGLIADFLPGVEAVMVKLKGYAEMKVFVAGSVINIPDAPDKVKVELTLAPVTLNASAEVKVKLTDDITIKAFSFKKAYEITKKYSWYKEWIPMGESK